MLSPEIGDHLQCQYQFECEYNFRVQEMKLSRVTIRLQCSTKIGVQVLRSCVTNNPFCLPDTSTLLQYWVTELFHWFSSCRVLSPNYRLTIQSESLYSFEVSNMRFRWPYVFCCAETISASASISRSTPMDVLTTKFGVIPFQWS